MFANGFVPFGSCTFFLFESSSVGTNHPTSETIAKAEAPKFLVQSCIRRGSSMAF